MDQPRAFRTLTRQPRSGPNGPEIAKRANLAVERAEAIGRGAKIRKKVRDRIVQAASEETESFQNEQSTCRL